MGFEYVDEELELSIKGEVYKFRAPSGFEQKQIRQKFMNADEKADAFDIYCEFFVDLGLPAEVVQKMSMKGLSELFAYSVGAKKN